MRREPAAVALILLVACVLRALVIAAIPADFGPGDPAIYRAMARGIAEDGAPRIDFTWHWLTRAAGVAHVEDYYEPAFAALLAPVALAGGGPAAMACVPLAFSLLGVLAAWWLARRVGPRAALAAAAIVALDPWSVYLGGVVMKESLVAVLVVAVAVAIERAATSARRPAAAGAMAGAVVGFTGLFQYELLPVSLAALVATLAIHRRAALPAALLVAGAIAAAATAWAGVALGVPLSAKAYFFLGQPIWTPEPAPATAFDLARFVPFGYALRRLFEVGQPALLVLAALGALASPPVWRTVAAALVLAWTWTHAVPLDLWERDFVPLLPLLAALAVRGLAHLADASSPARAARWAAATAVLAIAPWFADRVARKLRLEWADSHTWPALAITAVLLALAVPLAGALATRTRIAAIPALAVALAAVLAGAAVLLPLPRVYGNPQFPEHLAERAEHARIARWLAAQGVDGPVLTRAPWDFAEHGAVAAVHLPLPPTARALALARDAHDVRWLLLDSLDVADGVAERAGGREVAGVDGWRLYALDAAGD